MQKDYPVTKEPRKENIQLPIGWIRFIRYCEKIDFGELQRVQIQNGVPVSAEKATEKIKFN